MPYAPVDGLEMYYEVHGNLDAGEDVPLVLVPGGLQTIDLTFGDLVSRFAARRPVIAVELQGHGRTPDVERDDLSIARLSLDLVQVLTHLQVDRANLLGFSLGGLVSLETAVSHPNLVRNLVLAATHYTAGAYLPEVTDESQTSPRLPTEAEFEAMLSHFAAVAPDPEAFEVIADKYQPVVHAFEGWTDEQLRGLAARTLLIAGDFDFFPVEHAAAMAALIPDCGLAILPRTRHTEVMKSPLIPQLVEDFLTGPDAS